MCTKARGNKQTQPVKYSANQVEEVEEIVALEAEHSEFREKFLTTVMVNGKDIKFEVDSGVSVSIMSKRQFIEVFPDIPIIQTNLKLITYCKNSLDVLGYVPCTVTYDTNDHDLNLYIVTIDREPLLGREWIRQIKLYLWDEQINNVLSDEVVNNLKSKFPSVFLPGVGKIEGVKASLHLKENLFL